MSSARVLYSSHLEYAVKVLITICRPSSSIASSQSLMATIGETLIVEKATGKRAAKHQAADRILYQYIYHDTRAIINVS